MTGETPFSLRAATAADEPFLRRLYRETRRAELAALSLGEAEVRALCDAQFDAQAVGYRSAYPQARHLVVCGAGEDAGRLITAADADGVWLVDLALLPAYRGRGWGRLLVGRVQAEARASGLPLRLHVERSSTALDWYRALGFAVSGEQGTHVSMAWSPS